MITWYDILDTVLTFFQKIGDFANWLFSPIQVDAWDTDNGFLLWVHGIIENILENLNFRPVDILGIGAFTLLIVIGILKLVL